MPLGNESNTLVCLFHDEDHAKQVLHDLRAANVPPTATTVIGGDTPVTAQHTSLEGFGIPTRDLDHLKQGLAAGGMVIVVNAASHEVDTVEDIFAAGKAATIDEAVRSSAAPVVPAPTIPAASEGMAIPVLEEELQVGKRSVDRGGVRVYSRIVEVPAEASVTLHEEHAVVERNAVDRPATAADLAQQDRSILLHETAEEAVIGKTARVVEEIRLTKEGTEHTEQIHDTVRKTQVEVEQLAAENNLHPSDKAL